MMRIAVLVASCLALCASASDVASNVELAVDSHDLLMAGGLSGLSSHEDVLVRRLEAMQATKSDAELRAQAQVLFKLYKALNAKEVAAMGSTESAQFEAFYKTIFQQIRARANAKKSTTPSTTTKTPSTSTTSPSSTSTTTTAPSSSTTTTPSSSTTTPSSTSTTTPSSTSTTTTKTPSTSGTSTPSTTSTPSSTTKSPSASGAGSYLSVNTSDPTTVADSLSFFTQVYDPSLAQNIRALQDNTQNIEAIVQSTKSANSSQGGQFQAPTVLEGVDNGPTTLGGRRLANSSEVNNNVQVLFCDVTGNAIWQWSNAPADAEVTPAPTSTTIETQESEKKLCQAQDVVVKVTAYQSGCSRQNHPDGCDKVYWKGCGGLTVNRAANRIVVARTGGRSLGILYYKDVSNICQGRVVDAITTYKGKKFNSISYAEYSPSGNLYFTDSPFGLATSPADFDGDTLDKSPLRELPFNGVFLLKSGSMKIDAIDCGMDRPNKIAFSPKGDVMYITNSRKGDAYVKSYALNTDGTVASAKIFFNFTAHPELETDDGIADGIKTDDEGNVYVAVYKGVYILSPQGALIGTLQSSQPVSGIAIGGGRMFLSGNFGVVSQATGVKPALGLPSASTSCSA